jgi:hypothetical protein
MTASLRFMSTLTSSDTSNITLTTLPVGERKLRLVFAAHVVAAVDMATFRADQIRFTTADRVGLLARLRPAAEGLLRTK